MKCLITACLVFFLQTVVLADNATNFANAKTFFDSGGKLSGSTIPFPGSSGTQSLALQFTCIEKSYNYYQPAEYSSPKDEDIEINAKFDPILAPRYSMGFKSYDYHGVEVDTSGSDFGGKAPLYSTAGTQEILLRSFSHGGKPFYTLFRLIVFSDINTSVKVSYCWSKNPIVP